MLGFMVRNQAAMTPLRIIFRAAISLLLLAAPAFAQQDLSGTWSARNYGDSLATRPGPGPSPVDFTGVPLNDAARSQALTYSPSKISMPDRVCTLYAPSYVLLGPFGLKLWNETEPRTGTTVAWKIGAWEDRETITVWMDGRAHPGKSSPHETSGFTTGTWENDVLTTYTTHMRTAFVRRNGIPLSDQATMTLRFFRHDDWLTLSGRIDDPAYLTEPLYLTRTFQRTATPPMHTAGQPCIQGDEGVPENVVPHYTPDSNPFVEELTKLYGIPQEAILGGAQTLYPDFRKQIRSKYVRPDHCTRYCGGPGEYPLRVD
jgi:hypothetical protein